MAYADNAIEALEARNDIHSGKPTFVASTNDRRGLGVYVIDRGANRPCYFGLFCTQTQTSQCLSFRALRSSCCIMSQQFSLRFNDSQSSPATPCDMNATWMEQFCRPRPADFQDAFQTHSGHQVAT
jgi:hypothetical protein